MTLNTVRASRVGLVVCMLMAAILAGAAAVSIWVLREQEIDDWRKQMDNLSLTLAENTGQMMNSSHLVLDGIAERIGDDGIGDAATLRARAATAEMHQLLRDKTSSLPHIDVATIVASNGDVVNFSRAYPAPAINLADRDYFQARRDDPTLGDFISAPVRNKGNGKWVFYISRRLNGSKGEFIGMVLVGISSQFISDFYNRISLGEKASLNLYRNDFVLLARWPRKDDLLGKANLTGSTYTIVEKMKKRNDVILTTTPRFADANQTVYRMGASRVVEQYPLIVNVTITEDLFLSSWYKSAALIAAMAIGSILALLVSFSLFFRMLRQREGDMEITLALKRRAEDSGIAGATILLVEDGEANRRLAEILLNRIGCKVTSVVNGLEALQALEQGAYDLVLMDCMMPEMDGYEATRVYREFEKAHRQHRLPIVALTASATSGYQERCKEAGMDDYLAKPYSAEALGNIILHWVEPGRRAAG